VHASKEPTQNFTASAALPSVNIAAQHDRPASIIGQYAC
jgi:hypothetical protein